MITSVVYTFRGVDIPLTLSNGVYTADFTAPDESSWFEPEHVYPGFLTAVDGDGNTDTLDAPLRVVETVLPSIGFVEPMENWFFPTLVPRVVFQVFDAESGVASVTATLDGNPVVIVRDGANYIFTGIVEQGRHTLVVTAVDNDENVATATRHFAAAGLITDRTAADVEEVKALSRLATNGDAESYARIRDEELKGAYNASDLNRVGFATECVGIVWTALGYIVPTLTAKQDWGAVPTNAELAAYLADSGVIHDLIPAHLLESLYLTIPDAPTTMTGFDFEDANDIEKILYFSTVAAKYILQNTFVWACGEIAAGED